MKLLASALAAATLSCAIAALVAPAFAQPRVTPVQPTVTQHQPQQPAVIQTPEEEAPPLVRVTQPPAGRSGFSGVIESIATKYTAFIDGASPRATTDLGGLEKDKGRTPPPDATNITPQTSTSPHRPRAPLTPRTTSDDKD